MSKTFKDMRKASISAAQAKKLARRASAKRDVLNILAKAYDSTSHILDFQDDNERSLTREEMRALI